MYRPGWTCPILLLAMIVTSHSGSIANGQVRAQFPERAPAEIAPHQEDATLHDIQFVGPNTGWAVGDHGVIWKTTDGGTSWTLQSSGITCTLRSATFLTDRVGWVAGGRGVPYANQGTGIVLATDDGGTTWKEVGGNTLPELHRVRFFTLTHGIAVGESDAHSASGVIATTDGGKTWKPAPGEQMGSWRAADFLSPEAGAVAGLRGERTFFSDGRLTSSKVGSLGLRGLHALRLLPQGEGWMVGDGGLVLHLEPGQIVWKAPPQGLPRESRDLFDFRAVAARGKRIWIAGEPGSVIWNSQDGGQNWERQLTRNSLPIRALSFPSDEIGFATGALGTILRTTDGGETWMPVRGGNRRLAYWVAPSLPSRMSLPLIGSMSGEQGYRGLVSLIPRFDLGNRGEWREIDLSLSEATLMAGGAGLSMGWRLPVDMPGLELNSQRLIEEWTRRSEGNVQEQLIEQIVRQLRTWRPSVVFLDQSPEQDALGKLLYETSLVAIASAADATSQLSQLEVADLAPWQVSRIFVRLPSGSNGQVHLRAFDLLPRQGKPLSVAVAPANSFLPDAESNSHFQDEAYKAVNELGEIEEYHGVDFFAGLGLSPGTEARRALPLIDDSQHEEKLKQARSQRNLNEYWKRFLHDSRHAQQLIGQIADMTRRLPDDQAALLLARLADQYRRRGQWQLAEDTLVEMVHRYPREDAAQDAMRFLLQLWVSNEMAFHRLQETQVSRKQISVETKDLLNRLQNAGRPRSETVAGIDEEIEELNASESSLTSEDLPLKLNIGEGQDLITARADLFQEKARQMATLLERMAPARFQSPELQFPLSSLYRQRQRFADADACLHLVLRGGDLNSWQRTATTELWLNQQAGVPPKPIYSSRSVVEKPLLDGLLNDNCWVTADEMPLKGDPKNARLDAPALVLICHDAEFLYIAGICPRVDTQNLALPQRVGRTYDADLSHFDRVTIQLDIDRDYVSFYRFQIDQRGWTADDLWGDVTWNPKWFVAADAEDEVWRFEVAIPWQELVPRTPHVGTTWALNVTRTIPAYGSQGWTEPQTLRPRLENGGLLRLE